MVDPSCVPCKVSLYVGKSIADLDKKSEFFPSIKIKKLPILKMCKCSVRLLDEAQVSYEFGDQEMAYIKYNRYFTLIHLIRSDPEYNKYKATINTILGSNATQLDGVARIEALIVSLKNRYQALADLEAEKNCVIELDNPYKNKTAKKATLHKKGATHLPDLSCRDYITCQELYTLVSTKTATPKEILFDCRPYNDFFESKIIHPNCLNVDEEKIQHGVTAGQLATNFASNTRDLVVWQTRNTMDHAILYDWNTNEDEPVDESPLFILMGILKNWDPDVNYKSLKFLKGGYEEFLTLYPQFTTNSAVVPPCKITPNTSALAEIEYPSIADITMKEESFVELKTSPVINRDTKPESLKKFTTKTIRDMVDEREKLADKSVSLEKERLIVETQIKEALIASECAQDEQTKQMEIRKVIELEYDVMQLENSKQDVAEESIIVTEKICEEQEFVPDAIPMDKMKIIQEKELEAQKLNELNEQLAHEKRLSDTREITPIKAPQFDRTTKPVSPIFRQRDLDPEMASGPTVRGLCGLRNIGASCYLNSALQALSNTNSLTECFITNVYKKFINKSSKTKGSVVENLANVIRSLWYGKYASISPIQFIGVVGRLNPRYNGSTEQDSHEFLINLIQWLHEELKAMPEHMSSPKTMGNTSDKEWMCFRANNESIILDLFYGQMKSTLKCRSCNYESSRHQHFSNLNVGLPEVTKGKRYDLADCLNYYFNGETMDDWRCSACGEKCGAIQKVDITRLPPVLIIQLNRFTFTKCGLRKLETFIRFPLEHLQMNSYIAPSELRNKQNKTIQGEYKLYATINHYGDLNRGHYTAYCRNVISGRWYRFNDAKMSPLNMNEVQSSAAFVLFYTKLSDSIPPEVSNLVE